MTFSEFILITENEELMRFAHSLGDMPREEVEKIIVGHREEDRIRFARQFSWSIPCKEAVDAIKRLARPPVYDVMAGTGYWGFVLKRAGLNVIMSDIDKPSKNMYQTSSGIKEKIIRRNALKVGHHMNSGRLNGDLLIAWPPYGSSFSTNLLSMIPVGTRVFYVGEGMGKDFNYGHIGATGDVSLHRYLTSNFKLLDEVRLPNWDDFMSMRRKMKDHLEIWEKEKQDQIDDDLKGKYFVQDPEEDF